MRDFIDTDFQPALIGGGASSLVWTEIIANVMDVTFRLVPFAAASHGAALLAGIAVGAIDRWPTPSGGTTVAPNAAAHRLYTDYFEVYQEAADALTDIDTDSPDSRRWTTSPEADSPSVSWPL